MPVCMDTSHSSVYRQVLGGDFDGLAPALRTFHGIQGCARFNGRCRIECSQNFFGRMVCWLLNLPMLGLLTAYRGFLLINRP